MPKSPRLGLGLFDFRGNSTPAAAASCSLAVTMTFAAAALVVGIIVTTSAASFVIRVIMAFASAALVFFFMIMPATATTLAVSMRVTMTATTLCNANGFELTAFKLGDGFCNDFGARAVDLDALVEHIAQRHAIDAGAQHGVNRRAFLFGFFVNRNRGDRARCGIENNQMAGVGKVRFGGRLQAVGFLSRDAELHGVSSELD